MSNIDILIIENQYFPNINWFKNSFYAKHVLFLPSEPYKKMSFRNRTIICGANGLINLSVPIIKGRNQKVPFRDIKISYEENWQINHWRSLISCYGKSPFFYFYEFELRKLFEKRVTFLFDMNLEILDWLKKVTELPAEIIIKREQDLKTDNLEVVNMTDRCLPKNFQMDLPLIKYPQVFEDRIGFQANLSILDMIFNVGTEVSGLLGSTNR